MIEATIVNANDKQIATMKRIARELQNKCYVVMFDIQGDDTILYRVQYAMPSDNGISKCVEFSVDGNDWVNSNRESYKQAKELMIKAVNELMFDRCYNEVIIKRYTIETDGQVWED